METINAIEVKGLWAAYEDRMIIEEMNLKIPKGNITIIIGANGCGKSTLLKVISRILPAKRGEVRIEFLYFRCRYRRQLFLTALCETFFLRWLAHSLAQTSLIRINKISFNTIFYKLYHKFINSYKQIPVKIN